MEEVVTLGPRGKSDQPLSSSLFPLPFSFFPSPSPLPRPLCCGLCTRQLDPVLSVDSCDFRVLHVRQWKHIPFVSGHFEHLQLHRQAQSQGTAAFIAMIPDGLLYMQPPLRSRRCGEQLTTAFSASLFFLSCIVLSTLEKRVPRFFLSRSVFLDSRDAALLYSIIAAGKLCTVRVLQ